MHRTRGAAGVTLIELMIVVVAISILAAIAIPSYQDSVRKTRRTDAKIALNDLAQRLERCRTQFGAYDDGACPTGTVSSPEGHYSITITSTAAGFTLDAVATGVQTKDNKCATLSLDNFGLRSAKAADDSDATGCW